MSSMKQLRKRLRSPSMEDTSAVNAAARGTLNQDPFSVNLADGVGQGAEPEISPTAPDDALNQNSDDIKYLNDTDHSQGPTEENLIETVLETIASTDSGDHEFRGDFHSDPQANNVVNDAEIEQAWMTSQDVQQTLESINIETTYLSNMIRKIGAFGITSTDVYALESRYPGILVNVGNGFSLESNESNTTYALEAIKDKFVALKTKGLELLTKLIEWIATHLRQLGERLRNGRLSTLVKRYNTLVASKVTVLEPSEVRRILGDEVYQAKIIAPLNLDGVNAQLKSKISADDLSGIRTGATVKDVLQLLSTQSAIVPKNFGHFKYICQLTAEVANDLSKANATLFVADAMYQPTQPDEPRTSKSIVNDDMSAASHGNENTLASITGLSEIKESDLRDLFTFYSDSEKAIADTQRKLKTFMSKIKNESPDQVAAYKDQREQMYDFLRGVQENINLVNRCVWLEAVVLNLVNSIIASHTKENVERLKAA